MSQQPLAELDPAARPAADAPLDGILPLLSPWPLHHGGVLEQARVAYRLVGPAGAPVVAALGGISGHRVVAAPKGVGWWPALVGPGLGLDTTRYRVLGIDYLGGRGQSSTPAEGAQFPAISGHDQAEALYQVVRHLGLRLHAIIGASYGGMVAMSFGARHPQAVGRLIVISTADRAQPQSTAWRSVQRQIVRDALARGEGAAGLKLARALAMATYRSPAELAQRFDGEPLHHDGRFRFPVEDYLFSRGDQYVQHYRPESFVSLSESIDLFRIDPAEVAVDTTLIAVREDQLVPLADIQALAGALRAPSRLIEISSICGHDAFLTEGAMLKPIIEQALKEGPK